MNSAEQATLRQSMDPKELVHAAQVLATSDDPADHRSLSDALVDAGFLGRLDDDAAYEGRINQLRVGRVLRTLGKHVDASRGALLVRLTGDQVFLQQELRIDLLIKACASLRPSPPEVVAFWEAHCQPDDGFANLTIAAVIENSSPPALELFVTSLLDPAHDESDKLEWLRQEVLTHRQNVELLRACRVGAGAGPGAAAGSGAGPGDLRLPPRGVVPAGDPARAARRAPDPTGDRTDAGAGQAGARQVSLDERTERILQDFVRGQTP
jgi:hypothetical protein